MNVTWLPINKDTLYYLNISNELSIGTNPDGEKMEFWDNLYSKYYKIWDHPKSNIVSTVAQETSVVNSFTSNIVVEETIITTTVESEMASKDIEQSDDNEVNDLHEEKELQHEEELPSQTENETPVQVVNEEIKEAEVADSVDVVKTVEIREYSEVNPAEHNLVHQNGDAVKFNGNVERKPRPSNEIKMVQPNNINPKDVIRANDPPEDDLPKNIGVNKFVNFFESLGAKK